MRITLLCGLVAFLLVSASAEDQVLTHSTDFAKVDPALWVAEGWRVEHPDPGAVAVKTEESVALVVTTPNTAMAWTLTTEPLWTDPFSTLALSYFVDGPSAEDHGALIELFDGSTGPITPGATNTENPLASGGRLSCGSLTPGLHVELVDLSAVEKLDRVSEITITVRSGAAPVAVRLNQIAFLAKAAVATGEHSKIEVGVEAPSFAPLALPVASRCDLESVRLAHGITPESIHPGLVFVEGLPFEIREQVAVTPLNAGGALILPVEGRGDTLALLCSTRLWGSNEGWYSAGALAARDHASAAHTFRVVLKYSDGTTDVGQPVASGKAGAGLWAGLRAYRVALDSDRELKEVALVEDMSYGQVAMIAASVLDALSPETGGAVEVKRVSGVASVPAAHEDLVLESPTLRLVLDRAGLVHSLQVGADRRELVTTPFELVTLMYPAGAAYPLQFSEEQQAPEPGRLSIKWNVGEGHYQFEVLLEAREDGALVCTPSLSNLSTEAWTPWAIMPRMTALQLSRGGETAYILGARSALQDSAPIDTAEIYGGQFPLQFMDSYDEIQGGGLAYMVLDDTLTRKWFEFKKGEDGLTTMGVSYRNLSIAPGERQALPPTVLLPHEGDWRGPFQQYKAWASERFPRTRANGMKDLFYCRRDYPLGGTTYLFDPAKKAYSFEKLISESNWAFGGVDMVDISGWAYNEQIGRVGTYLKNDLGGLEGLASGVTVSHGRGSQVGLYFEGYLLDKRAANAERGLAEWQLIREGNKPAWWGGDMEFFCCPGAKGWQDALATDIAEVARVSQADAVYVDQLGICGTDKECWATSHGHAVPSNPIVEEIALLKRVREELDKVRPECAIYIEHIPSDAMTPWIDGAFNMGMKHTRHALGPTKLPLHRYLFPELPIFEMVAHGIRPIPAEEDDLKLAFFHGMGLWLKGKGASWYSQGFRQLAPKFHEVLTEYGDYFRSSDVLPHVDTLMKGVYANKFTLDGKSVYTIYNANSETVRGPLLKVEGAVKGTSLLDTTPFGVTIDGSTGALVGSLPPQGVAAILAEW